MSTYNEEYINKISSLDYLVDRLNENKQPSTPVPPEYTEDEEEEGVKYSNLESYKMSDLRENEEVQRRLQNVAGYFYDQKGGWANVFEVGVEDSGEEIDFLEYMRDEQNKLPTLINNSGVLKDAPKDVTRDYLFLQDAFNRSEVDTYYERYAQIADTGGDMISDPFNFIGLLAIPFTGGGSAAANVASKQLAKKAIRQRLLANLKKNKDAIKLGAAEGGAWAGTANYYEQSRDINTGLLEQDEVDMAEVGAMTAGGAAVGATLVAGLGGGAAAAKAGYNYLKDKVTSKVDLKNAGRASDTSEMQRELAEPPLEGELLGRERLEYNPEEFTQVEGDFLEGVFKVMDSGDVDEDVVASMVKDFVKKNGGGEATEHRLLQSTLGPKVDRKNKGAIAEGVAKAARTLTKLPAYYGGKVSTLLDPYVKQSETLSALQRKFRYDKQRTTFGERVKEDSDYSEVLGETYGKYYVAVKTFIDPLLQGTYGKNRDLMYKKLSNVIRGEKSDDALINTVGAKFRSLLDEAGEELRSQGLYDDAKELTSNYFPRLWDRKAIVKNRDVFQAKLIQVGEAADNAEAARITDEMLEIKFQFGDEASNVGGSSFLSTRKFNFTDDTVFEDFLNNDTQEVLTSYFNQISRSLAKKKTFGATNFKDTVNAKGQTVRQGFESLYFDKIKQEMQEAGASSKAILEAQQSLHKVWKAQTGEGIEPHNKYFQYGIDAYSTATRVGLLPLAALNSLSEIMLNISRGGIKSTTKGAGKAVAAGVKNITYGMVDRLVKNHNLTRSEAFLEMNRFGVALDQATADQVERLSGEGLKNFQKFNRTFFRATGLEPWTKVVQLTSFNVGRDIVSTNLKSIANAVKDKKGNYSNYVQTQIDQLRELNIDIDEGLAWVDKTGGDLSKKSEFNFKIDQAAARYTNEIILNPTRESGLRSVALSGNPGTTMLFQLTAYPAAFTNTILKDLVQRTGRAAPRGDFRTTARVAETAMAMLGTAAFTNYVKQGMFTKDDQFKFKNDEELVFDAVTRVGGLGFYFDSLHRVKKAADITGSAPSAVAGLFGPVASDVTRMFEKNSATAWVPSKLPLYAAWPKELRREITKDIIEAGQLEPEDTRRVLRKTGGVVTDVPKAPEEPDERIDKMTGMPYDQQAGTAYIDSEDPLRRMGFVVGSLVRPLAKTVTEEVADLINTFSKRNVAEKDVADVDEKLMELGAGEPEAEKLIKLETAVALGEKRGFEIDQLRERYPEAFDEKGVLSKGETFVESGRYTEGEQELFEAAGEAAKDLDIDDAASISRDVGQELERIGALDRSFDERVDDFLEVSTQYDLAQEGLIEFGEDIAKAQKQKKLIELTTLLEQGKTDPVKAKAVKLFEDFMQEMPETKRPSTAMATPNVDRDAALAKHIEDSDIKIPVYRTTGHGIDADYEMNYAIPMNELGTHYGTKEQATHLGARDYTDQPVDDLELRSSPETLLDSREPSGFPISMVKGYLNIKNPLDVGDSDYGNWGADNILTSGDKEDFIQQIIEQSDVSADSVRFKFKKLNTLIDSYIREIEQNPSIENVKTDLEARLRKAELNTELSKLLDSFGFDGVKYINKMEGPEEEYSYIAFKPAQFKTSYASSFDPEDPRVYRAEGGKILKSLIGYG